MQQNGHPLNVPAEVTFPTGSIKEDSVVLFLHQHGGRQGVVLKRTPSHPKGHKWPDQPGDRGILIGMGQTYQVEDSLTCALDTSTGELLVDDEIQAQLNDDNYRFHVLHVIQGELPDAFVGKTATLQIDEGWRTSLSLAHTGCHLASLALNQATSDLWRKEVSRDSLGYPDLDRLANVDSRIGEFVTEDAYRLGKSLRKKGFNPQELFENLAEVEMRINQILAKWLETGQPITIQHQGLELSSPRHWCIQLPEGEASIACGGTHARALTDFTGITVNLTTHDKATHLGMVTRVTASTEGT